jgi:hypothetical protein
MANPASGAPGASARRVLTASLIGTAVEFYDFYIYATAASLVFGPLFFPSKSASLQLLASYASLAWPSSPARWARSCSDTSATASVASRPWWPRCCSWAARPWPSPSCRPTPWPAGWRRSCCACCASARASAWAASGAARRLLAVENAPPGWRARFGMFPQLGAPVGFIAANGLFLLLGLALTPEQFQAWGWRLPFLGSACWSASACGSA